MIKIIFMGTPDIAVPTLESLANRFNVVAVVSAPDKPQGRGMCLTAPPVKKKAQTLGLEVLQPDSLHDNNFIERLKQIAADVFVVFAFRFLPKKVYSLAKIAAFNIHTSLLPDYRGAAPINWAIINGEETTGLSAFILEDQIDGGPIIAQQKIAIPQYCTAEELHKIVSAEAPDFATEICRKLLSNDYMLKQQSHIISHKLAPKIYKHTAEINWNQTGKKVINFIHGYSPQPCAWTNWNNSKLQILRAKTPSLNVLETYQMEVNELKKPGEYYIVKKTMLVRCENEIVELVEIKPESKKNVPIKDFINGYKGEKKGIFY